MATVKRTTRTATIQKTQTKKTPSKAKPIPGKKTTIGGDKGPENKGPQNKITYKITEKEKEQLLDLIVEGYTYEKAAKEFKKVTGVTLSTQGVYYHAKRNEKYIQDQRSKALDRARLRYPLSTFEGRMKWAEEIRKSLEGMRRTSVAKYRAMIELIKVVSMDESTMRELAMKETATYGMEERTSWTVELKEAIAEFHEENKMVEKLETVAGWK